MDAAAEFAAFAFGNETSEQVAKVYWDSGREVLVVESALPVEVRAERVLAVHVNVE